MRRVTGFTLIEVMIVLVVLSILLALAIPSYQSFILKSKRSDAKIVLSDVETRQEKHYFRNNRYAANLSELGFPDDEPLVAEGRYQLTLNTASGGGSYAVTATARGEMIADKRCRSFTLTSTGMRSATNSEGNSNPDCW